MPALEVTAVTVFEESSLLVATIRAPFRAAPDESVIFPEMFPFGRLTVARLEAKVAHPELHEATPDETTTVIVR